MCRFVNRGFVLSLLVTGCATKKYSDQTYLYSGSDSAYHIQYMSWTTSSSGSFSGYYTPGFIYLGEGFKEDVKLGGLILPAESQLVTSRNFKSVLKNETDSCVVDFSRNIVKNRHGRSALISVLNLVSAVKAEPYTKQDEPDTTLTFKYSSGKINYHGDTAEFLFKQNFRKREDKMYSGWLAFGSDSLELRQVKGSGTEPGNRNHKTEYWFELMRYGQVYAAVFFSNSPQRIMYFSKAMSQTDKILVATYFYISMFN